jgi:hypothetical protein
MEKIAANNTGAVGMYAFLRRASVNTPIVAGDSYAASQLRYSGINNGGNNVDVEGTNNTQPAGSNWRAMGSIDARAGEYAMSLFCRID